MNTQEMECSWRRSAASTPQERAPAPISHEAVWANGTVQTGAEIFALTGDRNLSHPARSEFKRKINNTN
jgi:hypothetical protein